MCTACSESYMHFGTGVLDTSAWEGVYVTQVCFYTKVRICDTLTVGCAHMCVCIYVCIWMCVYGCVYASMMLLDALTCCYWGFQSVYACVYVSVCVCVYMCACMCACVCVCVCMYVFLCICVHVCLCARACGCTYTLV